MSFCPTMSVEDPRDATACDAGSLPGPTAQPSRATRGGLDGVDEGGTYLTDEVFLYRVVSALGGADGVFELEDCYGLGVVRVSIDDLRVRRLRAVTPALLDD
jgi:hypothetical protein